ncbi:mitoguardin 2-like isoform X1 [Clavelina lepadiformis]|uniref:mitoguardin 2-like isoform X1 n=1 Tax=Clavelina lepadiformis TaxID=159417 RepID=UPI004041352B
MKKSAVVVSVIGVFALTATAIYWRRKRQKRLPDGKPNEKQVTVSRKKYHQRHQRKRSYVSTPAESSPSSIRVLSRRSRKNSCNASASSSTAGSVRMRFKKQLFSQDQKKVAEAEKLYQEGVDSLEFALEKWEKAAVVIHNTPTGSPSLPANYSRSESFSSTHCENKENGKTLNSNMHSQSEGQINALIDNMQSHSISAEELGNNGLSPFEAQLQSIVQRAQQLQETFDIVLYEDSDTGSDTDMTLTGFDETVLSDTDSESNESFVSARETWETRSVDSTQHQMWLYEQALEAVERGEVQCRTSRAELLDCFSEDEFLAKLHCVRQGVELMLQDFSVRNWLIETGRSMIECILCAAERNIDDFQQAFTRLIDFVTQQDNWDIIDKELKQRKVVQINFYDIVLDFLIMDAFEDLENPPSAVMSIMQNRWLADSLKESAIATAVWSVLKAKRSRLEYPDGFRAHLYDISAHVSPVLAWGFMGPDGKLKNVCHHFKKEMLDFLRSLFSFEHIRYTTKAQMADDILKLTRERFSSLLNYLQSTCLHNDIANGFSRS